jgi:hypothetical protein
MTRVESLSLGKIKCRDDVLVSVCFGDVPIDAASFSDIATLAEQLAARFRFYEIIVVAEARREGEYAALTRSVSNLRLFTVHDGTAFYRRRAIGAEEAIGDVVLLASVPELAGVNVAAMLERAADHQTATLATRGGQKNSRSLEALLAFLGRLAGFKVNLRDLQTLALPRTLLNQLLAHPDPDLALRFPPLDARVPLVLVEVRQDIDLPRDAGLRKRFLLLEKLLAYMAPRLLLGVTLTSVLLAGLGGLFGVYVVAVWLVRDHVAPGWLTLSAATSLSAFFLGVTIAGLSLGLQHLLSRTYRDSFDDGATEVNRVDLFRQVASELNVEFERTRPDLLKPTAP